VTDPLSPKEREERRRRMAEVFGDVLPEQTADDAGDPADGVDRVTKEAADEEWLKRQVPPHHG
jgi:hypothetical protein